MWGCRSGTFSGRVPSVLYVQYCWQIKHNANNVTSSPLQRVRNKPCQSLEPKSIKLHVTAFCSQITFSPRGYFGLNRNISNESMFNFSCTQADIGFALRLPGHLKIDEESAAALCVLCK